MADKEKVIKGLENCITGFDCPQECPYLDDCNDLMKPTFVELAKDALALLKEQEHGETFTVIDTKTGKEAAPLNIRDCKRCKKELGIESNKWNHIWEAPDGSFKGRCENCGFVHFFIEGHDSQYKFCPQCGEQKVI